MSDNNLYHNILSAICSIHMCTNWCKFVKILVYLWIPISSYMCTY